MFYPIHGYNSLDTDKRMYSSVIYSVIYAFYNHLLYHLFHSMFESCL